MSNWPSGKYYKKISPGEITFREIKGNFGGTCFRENIMANITGKLLKPISLTAVLERHIKGGFHRKFV